MTLELEKLTLQVDGQTHIYPCNLRLEKASLNVLLGPTLSGKTSLMRLMAGLDKPSGGRILWNGDDVTGKRVQDRDIAMVYQQFINYPAMSVYENIASPLRIKKTPAAEIDKAVRKAADMMKLGPFLERKPLELSGGQQQRCALARALVKQSGLVLLDEPLANLDYKLREELRAEIPAIFSESGAVFVYATTEPEEALLLGGNTATLQEGRITQFGKTADVYHHPCDALTANTFSNPPMNFLSLRKLGEDIQLGDMPLQAEQLNAGAFGVLTDLLDGEYRAGFRPNHLELHRHSDSAIAFNATLSITEITGSETYLHMQHDRDHWVGLVHGVHDLALGESVKVYLDPCHMYVFDQRGALVADAPYAGQGG